MYKHFDEISDPEMKGVDQKVMQMLDNARTMADKIGRASCRERV